jgi:hypothetical protein
MRRPHSKLAIALGLIPVFQIPLPEDGKLTLELCSKEDGALESIFSYESTYTGTLHIWASGERAAPSLVRLVEAAENDEFMGAAITFGQTATLAVPVSPGESVLVSVRVGSADNCVVTLSTASARETTETLRALDEVDEQLTWYERFGRKGNREVQAQIIAKCAQLILKAADCECSQGLADKTIAVAFEARRLELHDIEVRLMDARRAYYKKYLPYGDPRIEMLELRAEGKIRGVPIGGGAGNIPVAGSPPVYGDEDDPKSSARALIGGCIVLAVVAIIVFRRKA